MKSSYPTPWPQPGTVVSVTIFLFYRHKGIVSDRWHNGKPMVFSASARSGGVREEPWGVFAEDRAVTVEGYPGKLPSWEVLRRARALMGSAYDLLTRNCEHFVAYVHGLKPQSPQLAATVSVAVIVGLLVTAR
jgi:hypothetical protein